MEPESEVAQAADRNFVGSYRKLVEHSASGAIREFGAVTAFTTGLPFGIFNGCIVVEPAGAADLDASIGWIGGLDLPYRVWIREDFATELREVPLRRGLNEEARPFPGMVLQPVLEQPAPPPAVTVRPVEGRLALEEHLGVLVEGGMADEVARLMFPASFAADPDVRLFTAYIDREPVGTSLALRTGDVSGVYAVGTLPGARRRGVGTAATWAAVAAGRNWGCATTVLQSTEMGFSVYRAMGFRTVVQYRTFRRLTP